MRKLLLILAAVVGLVIADQAVKEIAAASFRQAAVSVIPNVFDLAYVENRGCAWGLLQGKVWPLAAFGVLALACLVWKRKSVFSCEGADGAVARGWRGCAAVAEPLLYAGVVGNLIDRIFRGYVIDMFDFHWAESHFPCFNLADSYICVSAALIMLLSLLTDKKK